MIVVECKNFSGKKEEIFKVANEDLKFHSCNVDSIAKRALLNRDIK